MDSPTPTHIINRADEGLTCSVSGNGNLMGKKKTALNTSFQRFIIFKESIWQHWDSSGKLSFDFKNLLSMA